MPTSTQNPTPAASLPPENRANLSPALQKALSTTQSPSPSQSPSQSSGNLQSGIPQSEIRNPQSPDPVAAAFAPLFDSPVEHYIPGGNPTMPIIPRQARTNQAGLERLKYVASRAELSLVEYVDRFAVCGIIGSAGQADFEFITRQLWRLTAVRKSLVAMEANPNASVPEDLFPNLHATITDNGQDPAALVKEARSAVPSLGARTPSSASATASQSPFASTNPQSNQSASPSVNLVNPVNTVNPVPSVPATPASPSIPAVPQCPTFSPENLVRTLDRTTTDLSSAGLLPAHSSTSANSPIPSPPLGARTPSSANATFNESPSASPENTSPLGPRTSSSATPATSANAPSSTPEIGPLPLTPPHPSHTSHPSHSYPSPQSNIPHSPEPDPPCPRASTPSDPAAPRPQCTECDAELCPSRIAVPIFTGILKRTQKCDGACRFCSTKRQHNCPYTLPRFRASPAA